MVSYIYIGISSCEETNVVNNVLQVNMIDTKVKYTELFTIVLVSNKYHRFKHVWMMSSQEHSSISYDQNVGITTVIWVVLWYFL